MAALERSDVRATSKEVHVSPNPGCKWEAVHNWQPPRPGKLTVTGVCDMPTPGYRIELKRKVPQGINPSILLLEKIVTPPTGPQPEVVTPTPVRAYEEVTQDKFKEVMILPDNARVEVRDVF